MLEKVTTNEYRFQDSSIIIDTAYGLIKSMTSTTIKHNDAVTYTLLDMIISRLVSKYISENNDDILLDKNNLFIAVNVYDYNREKNVKCSIGYIELEDGNEVVNGVVY